MLKNIKNTVNDDREITGDSLVIVWNVEFLRITKANGDPLTFNFSVYDFG